MGFSADMAAIDEAVFDHLADDTAATWTPKGDAPVSPVRVILETQERPAELGRMSLPQTGHVLRVLASELAALLPGVDPGEGDAFTVNGAIKVVRGQPWRDGGDWVCLVS